MILKKNRSNLINTCILLIILFQIVSNCFATTTKPSDISGDLQNGFRVLTLPDQQTYLHFTVYRGDYIKFKLNAVAKKHVLVIPTLLINQELDLDFGKTPYFKMKKVGLYPFSIGSVHGEIRVIEYSKIPYHPLTADEAHQFIKIKSPLILDVRTPREYRKGHLENSILIPIQELQQNYTKLLEYKDKDIFIYCATGNRSTVAAKVLIDHGFNRIYNLRNGLYDWGKKGYPVVH